MMRKTLSHNVQEEYSPNYRSGVDLALDAKPPSFFPFYTYDGLEILLYVCP